MDHQTMSDMKLDSMTARAGTPARAVVCAGGVDTIYLRAGRGEPIVFLVNDVDAADVRQMIDVLARHSLVFAATPALSASASWLRDFLEGLGVTGAHVLVHASLAINLI
jgi:hypothetical protein